MRILPWHPTPFRDNRDRRYPTMGHYIMAHKALVQNDKRLFERIMRTRTPIIVPTRSRAWRKHRMQIALDAVYFMVRQYPQFHGKLISSGCEDIIDTSTEHKIDVRDNLVGRAIMMFRADLYPTIVVPYRATDQPERAQQLERFRAHMATYLPMCPILVVEQRPGEPFNRGALLNYGVRVAETPLVCLHDVDLLPGEDMLRAYTDPLHGVRHIARAWKRYNYDSYMGGIVLMRKKDFVHINGFPNDFWGWGGEDDEFGDRIRDAGIPIERVEAGTIIDQEGLDINEKMSLLRDRGFKCPDKWERREWHRSHRGERGYMDRDEYEYLARVL